MYIKLYGLFVVRKLCKEIKSLQLQLKIVVPFFNTSDVQSCLTKGMKFTLKELIT